MSKPFQIPGITALRLFAALAVIIGHVEMMKKVFGLSSLWNDLNNIYTAAPIEYIWQGKMHWTAPLISQLGFNAVVFFFVLSGFLITHVLITETQKTGTFSIRQFYWRRVIRIWPLYLLIVGFAFLAGAIDWPLFQYPQKPITPEDFNFLKQCYFLFSPNVALLFIPALGMIGHLWSIGVEEHFYLFWPWLMRIIKNNQKLILFFGAAWVLCKILFTFLTLQYQAPLKGLAMYFIFNKFECMALGGFLAFVFNDKFSSMRHWIFHHLDSLLRINILIALVFIYSLPDAWSNHNYLLIASLSGLLILKVSQTKKENWLNSLWIKQLGNASYAIYIVHFPVVLAVINIYSSKKQIPLFCCSQNILLYSIVVSLSLALGWGLHRYVEVPLKSVLLSKH